MKGQIGRDFKTKTQVAFIFVQKRNVTRKNKPWLMNKTFKWTEQINQKQPDGTHIYKYANPYSNCRVTFIINQKGIVIDDFSEGDDCDA